IESRMTEKADPVFLEKIFHKLLLNFTWWVNRKDAEGKNIFQGGFLGLDNIGVFDRSATLPTGGHIEQSDGTSWMGMYCLNLLAIAMELARLNPSYEDVASKFFEHFMYIAHAMNNLGLWDETDGFFYDVLHLPDGTVHPLKVRSMVGLIPLFAVETVADDDLDRLPRFKHRMQWFIENRPDLSGTVAKMNELGLGHRRILSIVNAERLVRILRTMLDETEFLSPYGIRALSRYHLNHPYVLSADGSEHRVQYEPAESTTGIFGGNSNWRGPIWFPLNFLIIESLQKYHYYYGDDLKVEFPTGSGTMLNLWEVARELSRRLISVFLRDSDGRRPAYGGVEKLQSDPHWR
ncbi:MAG: MGH1-like glycoside hydrolase domain-containing protein, partial [Vicinamibacteria bacterium]